MAGQKVVSDRPDESTRRLDLRGLRCPLPVLKIRRALKDMAPDETLVALCDDPLAAVDVPNFLREAGDRLLEARRVGDALAFRIAKAGSASP